MILLEQPRVDKLIEGDIKKYRAGGMGIKKIAKHLAVGVSVVQRVVRNENLLSVKKIN